MINCNFGFTPLKEVWIGDSYPESFFTHLPAEVADPLCQITQWCKEDTLRLQKFLEGRGIKVQRPKFDSIDDHMKDDKLVKPPITPRDHYLVLDKTLYSLHNPLAKDRWHHVLEEYKAQGYDVQSPVNMPINCLNPPSVVRVGRDLYIDYDTHRATWGFVCETMVQLAKKYRVNVVDTGGHCDSVFCPVAPGKIVTSHWKDNYDTSFPGWELFHVPNETKEYQFGPYRNWQLDNYDADQKFGQWIYDEAADWIGAFQETVFAVNMLVIDEKNIIAVKEHEPLTKWLEQRGITVHYFDFRTRSFFDGGWHCVTLDIHREDSCTDLFPNRGDNGVYHRENA